MTKYFTWKCRMNRFRYFNLQLLLTLFIVASIITTLPLIYPSRYDPNFVAAMTKIQFYTNLINIPILYWYICFKIQRFHDLNKSGWNVFWFAIPIVNLYFAVTLFFVKGTVGENQYGPYILAGTKPNFKESA